MMHAMVQKAKNKPPQKKDADKKGAEKNGCTVPIHRRDTMIDVLLTILVGLQTLRFFCWTQKKKKKPLFIS
jgi:hypothetical protein